MQEKKDKYLKFVFITAVILFVFSYMCVGIPMANATIVLNDVFSVTPGDVDAGNANSIYYTPIFSGFVDYVTQDRVTPYSSYDSVTPGVGGQPFELEAGYYAYDTDNVYFAVVTGMQPNFSWDPWRNNRQYYMGDIFIDLHDGLADGWDYAVRISDTECKVYTDINGIIAPDADTYPASTPYRVDESQATILYDSSTDSGVDYSYGKYTDITTQYNAKAVIGGVETTYPLFEHYAMEAMIDLDVFGLGPVNPFEGKSYDIHLTLQCGNDLLLLGGVGNSVPEPSAWLLLVTCLFGLVGVDIRRKKKGF